MWVQWRVAKRVVGLKGEEEDVEEGAVDVGRAVTIGKSGGVADLGLGAVDPSFTGFEPGLEIANGSKPFVELVAISRADLALE